jgi:hypothetical protein
MTELFRPICASRVSRRLSRICRLWPRSSLSSATCSRAARCRQPFTRQSAVRGSNPSPSPHRRGEFVLPLNRSKDEAFVRRRDDRSCDFDRRGATMEIAPGHDAWVEGDEPCVVVDFGASNRQPRVPSTSRHSRVCAISPFDRRDGHGRQRSRCRCRRTGRSAPRTRALPRRRSGGPRAPAPCAVAPLRPRASRSVVLPIPGRPVSTKARAPTPGRRYGVKN